MSSYIIKYTVFSRLKLLSHPFVNFFNTFSLEHSLTMSGLDEEVEYEVGKVKFIVSSF